MSVERNMSQNPYWHYLIFNIELLDNKLEDLPYMGVVQSMDEKNEWVRPFRHCPTVSPIFSDWRKFRAYLGNLNEIFPLKVVFRRFVRRG